MQSTDLSYLLSHYHRIAQKPREEGILWSGFGSHEQDGVASSPDRVAEPSFTVPRLPGVIPLPRAQLTSPVNQFSLDSDCIAVPSMQ